MPKINQEEYEVLKELDDEWKWIARDKDRSLYAFTEKPVRKYDPSPYWWDVETEEPCSALELIDEIHLFQFIQWEDEEPYSIAELIKEYEFGKILLAMAEEETVLELEYESEETEVKKDLNWFKEQLDDIEMNTPRLWSHDSIWMLDRVNELLNQLDEPDEREQLETAYKDILERGEFWFDDKEYKVVPKQEEVEEGRVRLIVGFDGGTESYSLNSVDEAFETLTDYGSKYEVVPKQEELEAKIQELIEAYKQEDGAYSNSENAWIDGFITDLEYLLEKEQKYYVEDGKHTLLCKWESSDGWKVISTIESTEDDLPIEVLDFELTEQEIKDYDERYLAFKVPVEELEE